jgi:hypothetical protein
MLYKKKLNKKIIHSFKKFNFPFVLNKKAALKTRIAPPTFNAVFSLLYFLNYFLQCS